MFNHLEDIGMTYVGHMRLALLNSLRLLLASFALLIHGILPFLFVSTASDILKTVLDSFPSHGDRILIRFNTKWREDPEGRQWRVLVDGRETLASKVFIRTSVETIEEEIAGEQKFHFMCFGGVSWNGSEALVS